MMRPRLRWLLIVGAALAATAHVGVWYWPRSHAASPKGGAAASLLTAPDVRWAVWIPYPHQNLAHLESRIGALDSLAEDVATLSGGRRPALGRFGPWRVPPSRALAVAAGPGRRRIVVAEVFPTVRWLALAAGRLAGNPWLAGGQVELAGSPARVGWRRGVWQVVAEGDDLGEDGDQGLRAAAEGSAWLRLPGENRWLPPGLYVLSQRDDGLVLTTRRPGSETAAAPPPPGGFDGLALLAVESSPTGCAVLAVPRGAVAGALPTAVRLVRGDGSELALPGSRVAERLGIDIESAEEGDWRIEGWDASALRVGKRLLPWAADGVCDDGRRRLWWVDLDELARLTGMVADLLDRLPLVDAETASRWSAAARLTARLAPGQLAGVVALDSGAVEIQLRRDARPPDTQG